MIYKQQLKKEIRSSAGDMSRGKRNYQRQRKGWQEECGNRKYKKDLFGVHHRGSWKARKEEATAVQIKPTTGVGKRGLKLFSGAFWPVWAKAVEFLTSSWYWCCNPHWGFAKCKTKESICFSCFSSALVRFFSRVVFSFALIYSLSHHVSSPMLLFSIKFNVPSQILWESLPPWTVQGFLI